MKKYKFDIIVILIIIAIAGLSWMIIRLVNYEQGNYVVIYKEDKIWKSCDLNEDATFEINGEFGSNIIQIKNGMVYMSDADCPDRLCVKQGKISNNGEAIVCLPHKIIVKVIANKENNVDDIAK